MGKRFWMRCRRFGAKLTGNEKPRHGGVLEVLNGVLEVLNAALLGNALGQGGGQFVVHAIECFHCGVPVDAGIGNGDAIL